MDARSYLKQHGEKGAQALVDAVVAAGGRCTVGYFKQIAYGYRKPGSDLALLMVEHDPQKALDLVSLLRAREKAAGSPLEEGAPAEGRAAA
jgi:hypothetical protein